MDFNGYISHGVAFFQEGKIDLALENLEAALALQPDNMDLQQMVDGLRMQNELKQKMVQSLINEAKSRAKVMEELYGVKLEDIADVDNIIAEYTQNSNHDSAKDILASSYYIRGLVFESKGEYAKAVKDYSEAINNNQDYPLAFNKRGSANLEIGNFDQAIEDFKKANMDDTQLKHKLADAYMRRGIANDKKGDYANAVKDFENVLKFDPDNSTARELLNMAKDQV